MENRNLSGSRIRKARHLTKPVTTLEDLSARLTTAGHILSKSSLARMESGEQAITDIQLFAIANALHVSIAWLVGEAEDPRRHS